MKDFYVCETGRGHQSCSDGVVSYRCCLPSCMQELRLEHMMVTQCEMMVFACERIYVNLMNTHLVPVMSRVGASLATISNCHSCLRRLL